MVERDRPALVERAASEGAGVAHRLFREGIDVETKDGKTDVVTEADRNAQRRVIEVIREGFPDDAVVGEEEDELKEVPAEGYAWVIDPIDGTHNYVRNVRIWATAVAVVEDGEPIAAANVLPALGDIYTAVDEGTYRDDASVSVSDVTDPEAGVVSPTVWWDFDHRDEFDTICHEISHRFGDIRRYGSAQATLSYVACGSLDATVTNVECNPWDVVGGVHLVRQAGGTVTDLNGDRWEPGATGMVASNGHLHEEALETVRAVDR